VKCRFIIRQDGKFIALSALICRILESCVHSSN